MVVPTDRYYDLDAIDLSSVQATASPDLEGSGSGDGMQTNEEACSLEASPTKRPVDVGRTDEIVVVEGSGDFEETSTDGKTSAAVKGVSPSGLAVVLSTALALALASLRSSL